MDDILETVEICRRACITAAFLDRLPLAITLFLSGKKLEAIFVGLWAPTILNLGLYNKLLRPSNEVSNTPDIP
jgi:hypothetical protein